jgi:hypothetical protein
MRRTCSAEAGKEVRIDPIEVGRRRSKTNGEEAVCAKF